MPLSSVAAADDRFQLLLDLSQQISRTFDLQEILRHLLDSVSRVVGYDAAGVFVLNRAIDRARPGADRVIAAMAQVGFDKDPDREDPMLRSGKGIIGHVISTGTPAVVADVRADPHYVAGRPTTLSEVAVPIASSDEVIGALNLESDRAGAFCDEDARLLGFFATAAAIAIEKALLHHQVLEKERLDNQLAVARDVQSSLLPAAPPALPGYDIAGVNLPTMAIGGDYFDYIPLRDGRLGLVVADVSGKGVPAALIMATFRAALRGALMADRGILEVVNDVNRLLVDSVDPWQFVTAVYGVLDPQTGQFVYVNCGHNPPILLDGRGGRRRLDRGRPALGLSAAPSNEAGSVQLGRGDLLALFTDGVIELFDARGREFGDSRLEALLWRASALPAGDVVREVVRETQEFTGRATYEDDFTLVIVKRT